MKLAAATAPATLWRISNHRDLDGLGGERSDGRWHRAARGRRVVYLAENAATALLETLVNLKGAPSLLPDSYQILRIDLAKGISCRRAEDLANDWRDRLAQTRALGDAWLEGRSSALLEVPSAPAPASRNYLLNALHPDARKIVIAKAERISYDKRLFHVGGSMTKAG